MSWKLTFTQKEAGVIPANMTTYNTLGIDIGSTTVKIAVLNEDNELLFADYERHFANIQETLAGLLRKAYEKLGPMDFYPAITGSGGLTLSKHLKVPFVQEVVSVATDREGSGIA